MEKSTRCQLTNEDLDHINAKLKDYLYEIKTQESLENNLTQKKLQASMIIGAGVAAHVLLQYLFFNLNPLKIPLLELKDCFNLLSNKKIYLNHQTLLYYSAFLMLCALGLCALGYQAKKTGSEIIELAELLEQYTPILDTSDDTIQITQKETQTSTGISIEEQERDAPEMTPSLR